MSSRSHRNYRPAIVAVFCASTLACSSSNHGSGGGAAESIEFSPAVRYPLAGVGGIAIGDFDGDRKKDLAMGARAGLVIAYGTGDGAFGAPVTVIPGAVLHGIVAFDANRDGRDDLFLSGVVEPIGGVNLCFGQAGRTLSAPIDLSGATDGDFTIGDVDGDGVIDVLARFGESTGISYLAKGGASVRSSVMFDGFAALFAADLNGDGRADLVGRTMDGTSTEVALTGKDGQPHAFADYAIPANGTGGMLAVDVRGDGVLSPVSEDGDHTLFAQLPQSGGALGSPVVTPFTSSGDMLMMAAGDLDGDRRGDVLTWTALSNGPNQLGVLTGDGQGNFNPANVSFANVETSIFGGFAIGDLNRDGKNDIAFVDAQSFVVLIHR